MAVDFKRAVRELSRMDFEEVALRRLVWYLNVGGRRDWRAVEKPDSLLRDCKAPDYVLRDRVMDAGLTVEVTYTPYNPEELRARREISKFIPSTTLKDREGGEISIEELSRGIREIGERAAGSGLFDPEFFAEKVREAYGEASEKLGNYKRGEESSSARTLMSIFPM